MIEFVRTGPALVDLEQISDFIAQESPASAYRLTSRIVTKAAQMLADNPMIGRRGRVSGTRELVISGTAYIVADRAGESVEILAVVHGAQAWPESFPGS